MCQSVSGSFSAASVMPVAISGGICTPVCGIDTSSGAVPWRNLKLGTKLCIVYSSVLLMPWLPLPHQRERAGVREGGQPHRHACFHRLCPHPNRADAGEGAKTYSLTPCSIPNQTLHCTPIIR